MNCFLRRSLSGAANYFFRQLFFFGGGFHWVPEFTPLTSRQDWVLDIWSRHMIGCLSSPGDWVLGAEGWEAGIHPGKCRWD